MAAATAVVVVFLIPVLRPQPETVIQIAMLDVASAIHGADTNEIQLLQQAWSGATFDIFSESQSLRAWETNWPTAGRADMVKVVYDRAAAEIRISGERSGREFSKTLPVEDDLASAMKLARVYVAMLPGKRARNRRPHALHYREVRRMGCERPPTS